MADREPDLTARIARSVGSIDAREWDSFAGAEDPFLGHAFLTLLESSGSVGEGTGWSPLPVVIERNRQPIGAEIGRAHV